MVPSPTHLPGPPSRCPDITTAPLLFAALALSLPSQQASPGDFAWGDFDSDDLLDLFVVVDGAPRLYHNSGGGRFAEANRIPTEVWKDLEESGYYLHPEAFGVSRERGIGHKRAVERQRAAQDH